MIKDIRRKRRLVRLLAIGLGSLWALAACQAAPGPGAETVVLVHGLGRSARSLLLMESRLESAGYRVVSFDYPSTTEPIERLVDSLASVVSGCCSEQTEKTHIVTHSMGGVLVRSYLAGAEVPYEGRVVMMSPPNQGSEIVDAFGSSPLWVTLVGPAGASLGTDSLSVPNQLGPVSFPLGIIAGDRSVLPLGSWLIPGPDDGLVGVERAHVEGAVDFLVVPATHTMIMNRADVAVEVINFLRTGRFIDSDREPD